MDTSQQRAILEAVARAAKEEGCLVAPVGSVYFLLAGAPRMTTKDVDIVVHDDSLQPPSVEVLRRIAARLDKFGTAEPTQDNAVVQIRASGDAPAEIELIRGRSDRKGGFFPRDLLVAAAKEARREGNVLLYPVEYVLVLKADAAIDREDRAKRDTKRAEAHERRAIAFRADVISGIDTALRGGNLSTSTLSAAIGFLKESRQERVRALFASVGIEA